eukprot:TRINITY_DN7766_c0_g1_i1.p1 TRINITY_DN7766_c0_g1~~TRINITY_DN7766_c0_g1_i1.p1  ORF type:complete len:254 (-),score=75.01 TRINITY_DN7766_c0_g1_i1:407-1099(-)
MLRSLVGSEMCIRDRAYIYYGYIYALPHLFDHIGFNPYLIAVLGGLIEMPGMVLVMWSVQHVTLGRRRTHMLLFGLNTLLCLVAGFKMPLSMFVVVILCSRMLVAGLFSALYLYTSELYPTLYRTFGLGAAAAVSRVGAMVAPLCSTSLTKWNWNVEGLEHNGLMWTFGLVSVLGLVCSWGIKVETRGVALQDQEHQGEVGTKRHGAQDYQYNPVSTKESNDEEQHADLD